MTATRLSYTAARAFQLYRPAFARQILRRSVVASSTTGACKVRSLAQAAHAQLQASSSHPSNFLPPPVVTSTYSTKTESTSSQTTQIPIPHDAPRPYTFHIGASWAAKPNDPLVKSRVPFPADTLVGSWRDKQLSKGSRKKTKVRDAGEDFFFIQEVSELPHDAYFID